MGIGAVKFTGRHQHGCDDPRPMPHIRQPAQDSPRREDEIERAGSKMRSLFHSPLNEIGLQSDLLGKVARGVERLLGEVEPSREGAKSHQAERIQPDMTLQMEDTLAADITELC